MILYIFTYNVISDFSAATPASEGRVKLKVNLKQCSAILYCMANGQLRQLVYSMY